LKENIKNGKDSKNKIFFKKYIFIQLDHSKTKLLKEIIKTSLKIKICLSTGSNMEAKKSSEQKTEHFFRSCNYR